MCLGIPGQVIEISGEGADVAKVDVSGVRRLINVGLLEAEPLSPGDWVLIHVGFAMARIDEEEARTTLELLDQAGQAYQDELSALKASGIEGGGALR
jgi:hydrogenase expression/formation protein HypC